MKNLKKLIAIIPARSGSKGLKDKNIMSFNGKPLMSYTIQQAFDSKVFDKVIVSTDSEIYKDIASEMGAEVDSRPDYLSGDDSSVLELIEYILKKDENLEYDGFMLLQPTSPLRKSEDIIKALEEYEKHSANSIVSVCKTEYSPQLAGKLTESRSLENFIKNHNNKRRQDLEQYYRLNGSIYLMNSKEFLKTKNFYNGNSYPYLMERLNSIDIDDKIDFEIAEYLHRKYY